MWYLSARAFCLASDCGCFEECSKNVSLCDSCDCARPCNVRVQSEIASSPCINGECNSNGQCHQYMSAGFVFSACHCMGGYRGFDCADDEYVLSKSDVLRSLLTLTLSNFAYIPAIIIAVRRYYYTESLVYTAVLFFSSFYHACENNPEVCERLLLLTLLMISK